MMSSSSPPRGASLSHIVGGFYQRKRLVFGDSTDRVCDAMVHLNGLLPCLVVYIGLSVAESAYLAVFLYEAVCLVGMPLLTVWLRGDCPERRHLRSRLRPLAESLFKPRETRKCGLVAVGAALVVGFGGFGFYLAAVQREFDISGLSAAIRQGTLDEGMSWGSFREDAMLLALYCWFCSVNPILEELFWRGYIYAELGRLVGAEEPPPELLLTSVKANVAASSLLPSQNQTGISRWLGCAYFGSYHGIVVWIFVRDVEISIAAFAFLAVVSRLWIWLGERRPFGFPFITAFHAGADIAVILITSTCEFGWAKRAIYVLALLGSVLLTFNGAGFLAMGWRHERFPRPCETAVDDGDWSPTGDGGSYNRVTTTASAGGDRNMNNIIMNIDHHQYHGDPLMMISGSSGSDRLV